MPGHVARLGIGTTIAAMCLVAVSAQRLADPPTSVALYAGVGEELITFGVDVEHATLSRQSSVILPGFVQEAWASPDGAFLYVAWSNGGSSYTGSGVEPRGDQHGITAFRVDARSALRQQGPPASLRSRPIHITGDGLGRYLLSAYNDPSGVSVHAINADGSVGAEVPQRDSLDAGVYAHQVRVLPSNRAVVLVTRGNEPTASSREDPGALKVFHYDAGTLSNVHTIFQGTPFTNRAVSQSGSRIAIDPKDGNLFVALGDRSTGDPLPLQAQHTDKYLGKVIHITPEGKPAPRCAAP